MMRYSQPHLTHSVIMVRPIDFAYNEETGLDNEFQQRPSNNQLNDIRSLAQAEFNAMVAKLTDHGIEVIELGKNHTSLPLPDAVFPNNWFSTRQDGTLFIYPIKTENRRAEVQIEELCNALSAKSYRISQTIDLRADEQYSVLEGTGSLIFHHPSAQVFAAISERCEQTSLQRFAHNHGYTEHSMKSQSASGASIYHTNVLMSCGENFAVVAEDILLNDKKTQNTLKFLRDSVDDLIVISESQMTKGFCGNILQLKSLQGDPCIVMSNSAYKHFTSAQIKQLEKHGQLIPCAIPTIETIGGGSARCMLAENFLPQF